MKKLAIICLILCSFLAACAPTIYGVPQETWERMSEAERVEAIRVYEGEQQARRLAAEERSRREAMERERRAALERERQERIEAIHRGEGAYGELIRVRLQGGRIKVGDRHQHYEPVTFTIADGEIRKIGVADRKGRVVDLVVTYGGGSLTLDGIRFPYERRWGRGALYSDTGTSGALQLRGVDVFIEVRGRSSRQERQLSRLVVIRDEEQPPVVREGDHHRPPPPVTVTEKEGPRAPPIAVREKEPPKPPPVTVTNKEAPKPPPASTPASPAAEAPPRSVEVAILSGETKVRGRLQPLERTVIRLAEGESRQLTLKAGGENRSLSLAYRKGELSLDGTPGRGRDGIRLHFEKEWKTGKVYLLELRGRPPLEKVEVKVTGFEGK
jgi:hypothetical protein